MECVEIRSEPRIQKRKDHETRRSIGLSPSQKGGTRHSYELGDSESADELQGDRTVRDSWRNRSPNDIPPAEFTDSPRKTAKAGKRPSKGDGQGLPVRFFKADDIVLQSSEIVLDGEVFHVRDPNDVICSETFSSTNIDTIQCGKNGGTKMILKYGCPRPNKVYIDFLSPKAHSTFEHSGHGGTVFHVPE